MGEGAQERAIAHARRALAESAAATAILLDRDAWASSAAVHLLEGFGALADALASDASGTVAERLTAAKVPGLSDAEQAQLAKALEKLADAPRDGRDGADAKELRRLARVLSASAHRVLRDEGVSPGRWKWATAGIAAAGVVVAVAWGGGAGRLSGDARGDGWLGRYYPEPDFGGEPVIRYDERIDFDWLGEAPVGGIPADRYSVRWDTCLHLPADDSLELRIGSDDGSRVFLDGELVIDNWRDQAGNWKSHRADLSEGVHHVRVEYYENGGNALAILEMTGPRGPVDPSWLRPPRLRGGEVACAEQ